MSKTLMRGRGVQLSRLVDMNDPEAVFAQAEKNFLLSYPAVEFAMVRSVFNDFRALYRGQYPGYGACNTRYHDVAHVTDTLLAVSRLMDGYNIRRGPLPVRYAKLGLIAAILHDAGYIQSKKDRKGTGAKYTASHVERSSGFAEKYFRKRGLSRADFTLVKLMIACTDLCTDIKGLKLDRHEKTVSLMVGTGDILGQMASRCYLERLGFLYREFKEARIKSYSSTIDLLKKTVGFSANMERRLKKDLGNVQKYARFHFKERFKTDVNLYLLAIKRNMDYLKTRVLSDQRNYRLHLRRRRL